MSSSSPVDQLGRALDATGAVITGVRSDQWSNPTPCPEWNVRTLVNHLVGGNQMFAAILRGEPPPQGNVDHLGDDPVAAHRKAGAALQAAFSQPAIFERVFRVPAGTVPGAVALHLRITELLVHGWDLARATGQRPDFDPEAVQAGLQFAQANMTGERTGEFPFAPVVEAAPAAPEVDKLAAFMGRQV